MHPAMHPVLVGRTQLLTQQEVGVEKYGEDGLAFSVLQPWSTLVQG